MTKLRYFSYITRERRTEGYRRSEKSVTYQTGYGNLSGIGYPERLTKKSVAGVGTSFLYSSLNESKERSILRSFLKHESLQAYKKGDFTKRERQKQASDIVEEMIHFQHMLDTD